MEINCNGKAMVFRNDFTKRDGTTFPRYSASKGAKQMDGSYKPVWYFLRFRKGVEFQNKTQILIKESWADYDFYEKDGKEECKHGFFVNDFEILEADVPGFSALADEDIPF